LVGERVTHIRFGAGTVTAFAPPHIEITFSEGAVKTFAYPQSVDRFISFDGENAREKARRDREQADVVAREKEIAKMLADRQKAEEAARQRMEQLHEKKATDAKRRAARSAAARASRATGGKIE
jgi:hypothetical protein